MRTIKFRGKSVHTGEWYYGDLHQPANGICYIQPRGTTGYMVAPETVGQYTGLKDKNGKEIYEGDTITWLRHRMDGTGFIEQGHVEWRDIEGCYVVVNRFDTRDGRELIHLLIRCTEDIKVVGNIHDNPELPKGGEQ